jgi:hypothetical protein
MLLQYVFIIHILTFCILYCSANMEDEVSINEVSINEVSINDNSNVVLHIKNQNEERKITNTADKYTLEYLTNPQYKKEFKMNKNTNIMILNKEQCSFYKKRIIALTKDMLKGEYPSEHLEKIHKEYIISLINHFKKVDEIDLIQKEYSDLTLSSSNKDASANVIDASLNNEIMMIKRNKPISIDNFVTKKVIKMKKEIPIPQKKVLNVTTPEHKLKGIVPKQHKDKL